MIRVAFIYPRDSRLQQVEVPAGKERTVKGALYLRPGASYVVTEDEWLGVLSSCPELRGRGAYFDPSIVVPPNPLSLRLTIAKIVVGPGVEVVERSIASAPVPAPASDPDKIPPIRRRRGTRLQ
jgi:hypothetical protein